MKNKFSDNNTKIVLNDRFETLVHEAFFRLWPEKDFPYNVVEKYNLRLGDFNANIMLNGEILTLKYNLRWKEIDKEIHLGLIQHLLLKMLAKGKEKRKNTFNINLYNNFCKQIPLYVSREHDLENNCGKLRDSFARMNTKFFDEKLFECKLKWGRASFRRLASYNFHNDSITVSSVFKEVPIYILDLLMYHEMLHKDLQFDCRNGRIHTHTPEFKRREKMYPNFLKVEKEIGMIVNNALIKKKNMKKRKLLRRDISNTVIRKIQDFF